MKLTNNISLKLLSVFVAFLLWLVVVNVGDPEGTKQISNIPVQILNEDSILRQNMLYSVVDGSDVVSIRVTARNSLLQSISADDFVLSANLNDVNILGNVPITATCLKSGLSSDNYKLSSTVLKIDIDDKASKRFPVKVEVVGKPSAGYEVHKTVPSPDAVTITGPKKTIEKISSVVATVDVTDLSSDYELTAGLKLFNSDGDAISSNNLTFSQAVKNQKITVEIQLYQTKEVSLNFNHTGTPAAGYVVTGIAWEPTTVVVMGSEETLQQTNSITISGSELDISGRTQSLEKVVDISSDLPKGIELVDETDTDISVIVEITRANQKTIYLPYSQIVLEGELAEDYELPASGAVEVIVSGLQEDLDALTVTELSAVIQILETEEQSFNAVPEITSPEGITVVSAGEVTLTHKDGVVEPPLPDENEEDDSTQEGDSTEQ